MCKFKNQKERTEERRKEYLRRAKATKEEREEYMQDVVKRIDNYNRRADNCRKWHTWLKTIDIALSASIPVLAVIPFRCESIQRLTIAIVGAVVAILTTLLELHKFRENRMNYRMAANKLARQRHRYLTRTTPYHDKDDEAAFKHFVENAENIINEEHSSWEGCIGSSSGTK